MYVNFQTIQVTALSKSASFLLRHYLAGYPQVFIFSLNSRTSPAAKGEVLETRLTWSVFWFILCAYSQSILDACCQFFLFFQNQEIIETLNWHNGDVEVFRSFGAISDPSRNCSFWHLLSFSNKISLAEWKCHFYTLRGRYVLVKMLCFL